MSKLHTVLLLAGVSVGIDSAVAQTLQFDLEKARVVEHQITQKQVGANASIELQTRYGRFCVAPLPTTGQSDLAGSLTLASRCAMF